MLNRLTPLLTLLPPPGQIRQLLADSCSMRSALHRGTSSKDAFSRFRSFCYRLRAARRGNRHVLCGKDLGFLLNLLGKYREESCVATI